MTDTHVVDVNVILRYLSADHPQLHTKATRFFAEVRGGHRHAFVPESVLAECVYVMQRIYQVPRTEIAGKLTTLLGYRGIRGERVAVLRDGLAIYGAINLSFVDALALIIVPATPGRESKASALV